MKSRNKYIRSSAHIAISVLTLKTTDIPRLKGARTKSAHKIQRPQFPDKTSQYQAQNSITIHFQPIHMLIPAVDVSFP